MKIVQPSSCIIPIKDNPQKHIEEIARTCYKSEDLITEDSHKKFISNIVNRKHWAMLEHYIFIYNIDQSTYEKIKEYAGILNISLRYMIMTECAMDTCATPNKRCIISFSARTLLDMYEAIEESIDKYGDSSQYSDSAEYYKILASASLILKNIIVYLISKTIDDYDCPELFSVLNLVDIHQIADHVSDISLSKISITDLENKYTTYEFMQHGWKSVRFVCDRGVSHEIVRHRDGGHAQESTRYCTYNKDKFDKQISVIDPSIIIPKDSEMYSIWMANCEQCERSYFAILNEGANAQTARSVLPKSLKTEICCTFRNYEWCHFFFLRCDPAAHPQMRQVAIPLYRSFIHENKVYQNFVPNSKTFIMPVVAQ